MTLSCSKKLLPLLRGLTHKRHGYFCYLICLHSFAADKKIESCKKVCENKDFCNIIMPFEDIKI